MSRRQILKYNPKLKERARELRKNMTEAEVKLWVHIRKKQVFDLQFYRQRPIGNYIIDFYCPDAKLVIEVDGGQHFEDEGREYDEKRDAFLHSLKLKVLRFSNLDILHNIGGVMDRIEEFVRK
jgi:very-short-patch-repair endonuclease